MERSRVDARMLGGRREVVAEQRRCVHCGAPFDVNRRAGEAHAWCRKVVCQRERKGRTQRARRAEAGAGAREVLSSAAKQGRAAYMRGYRETHAEYRERERGARVRRRAAARARAVTEAGSNDAAAVVYVVDDPGAGTRLRVVTASGRVVTILVDDRGSTQGLASGCDRPGAPCASGVSAVTEAG